MLQGNKTYLVAIAIILTQILYSAEIIDRNTYEMLLGILAPSAAITMAAKVNRVEKKMK